MAAHASLPVARVRKVLSLYLESAVAKEEPQKVSGGASPYCLSRMSKTRFRNRHSAVKARVLHKPKQGYFINHSVTCNGCMAKHSLTSFVHARDIVYSTCILHCKLL